MRHRLTRRQSGGRRVQVHLAGRVARAECAAANSDRQRTLGASVIQLHWQQGTQKDADQFNSFDEKLLAKLADIQPYGSGRRSISRTRRTRKTCSP